MAPSKPAGISCGITLALLGMIDILRSLALAWYGRAGIALDDMLLYVTGGAAAVHTKSLYSHIHSDGSRNDQFRVDEWNWGWVAGFGTEWAFAPNWLVRSEILYIGTPDKSYAGLTTGTTVPSFTVNTNQSDHLYITRVGVNYRFGGPVVAKY